MSRLTDNPAQFATKPWQQSCGGNTAADLQTLSLEISGWQLSNLHSPNSDALTVVNRARLSRLCHLPWAASEESVADRGQGWLSRDESLSRDSGTLPKQAPQ